MTGMDAELFGWREGILLMVGLAVLYLVATVIRLLRVAQRRAAATGKQEPPLAAAPAPEAPSLPELTDTVAAPPRQSSQWNEIVDLELPSETVPGADAPPRISGFGEQLAEHLARSDLEREVRRLRTEMDTLRKELEELRNARNISPQYAEALALAQRGLTAREVADRMGISLAEAELVHALSRGESLFDEAEGERDDTDREIGDIRPAGIGRYEPGTGREQRGGD